MVLLGFKISLTRLETLRSTEVGIATEADSVTLIVRIDESRMVLSSKNVL